MPAELRHRAPEIINGDLLLAGQIDHPVSVVDEVEERLLVGEGLEALPALAPLLHRVRCEPIHNKTTTDDHQADDVSDSEALVLWDEGEGEGLGGGEKGGSKKEEIRTTLPSGTMSVIA
jgi:hypothetical protein